MSIKNEVKTLAQKFGIQISRYNPSESYEARIFRQIEVHKIDTVIDVGANDGGYGRGLRQGGYKGQILSFEPLPEAHPKLLATADKDPNWFIADRQAIGNMDGKIEINVAGNSTSSSILPMNTTHSDAAPQSKYIGVVPVPISRLDSVKHAALDGARSILLKVDTQGYEMQVLQGAEELLSRVAGLQLELSRTPLYEGQALFLDIIEWLAQRGFSLWSVVPGFTDPRTGRMLQMDGVFYKH